jgi:hypothetical protein
MIETTFDVRFRVMTGDPQQVYSDLQQQVMRLSNVLGVHGDIDRHGFARLHVQVAFEGTREGLALYAAIVRQLTERPNVLVSGIGYSLNDTFRNDNRDRQMNLFENSE